MRVSDVVADFAFRNDVKTNTIRLHTKKTMLIDFKFIYATVQNLK